MGKGKVDVKGKAGLGDVKAVVVHEEDKGHSGRQVLAMLGDVKSTVDRILNEVVSAWGEYKTQKPFLDDAIQRIERRQRLIIQAVQNILTGQQDEEVLKAVTALLDESEAELHKAVVNASKGAVKEVKEVKQ